jgi:hypothetical protein
MIWCALGSLQDALRAVVLSAQQLRQLGEVNRRAAGLVASEQLRRRARPGSSSNKRCLLHRLSRCVSWCFPRGEGSMLETKLWGLVIGVALLGVPPANADTTDVYDLAGSFQVVCCSFNPPTPFSGTLTVDMTTGAVTNFDISGTFPTFQYGGLEMAFQSTSTTLTAIRGLHQRPPDRGGPRGAPRGNRNAHPRSFRSPALRH